MSESNENTHTIGVSYDLYLDVLKLTLEMGEMSSPTIQRNFHVPFNISITIMDLLQLNGIVETEIASSGRYKVKI